MRRIRQPSSASGEGATFASPPLRSPTRSAWRLAFWGFLACTALACAGAPQGPKGERPPPIKRMTRPRLVQGAYPRCSPEATAHQLDVRVLVECVITVEGTTRDCQVRRGHPLLNAISLQAAFASRFEPATVNDQPVDVMFGIPFHFACVQGM